MTYTGVRVAKVPGFFLVYEDDTMTAKVKDKVKLNKQHYFTSKLLQDEKMELLSEAEQDSGKLSSSTMSIPRTGLDAASPLGFTPPHFGVTILGNSHGFDCKGSTSGYIMWINQRGIMVDPPPFSS